MKTIRNKTTGFLRVRLPGGKTLRLGPGKDGQIADDADQHDAVRKMIEAGEIEIVGEGGAAYGGGGAGGGSRAETHGHHQPLGIPPKGDR